MTRFFLTILFIGFAVAGWSQDQKKLEQKKAQILKEIREFEGLVNKESKKEKSVLNKIYENNSKIKLSQNLISTTSKQTRLLTDDIYLNQLKINKLNRELKVLKEDYSNMVRMAYKSRSQQSRIMFILSSESFLQAYKRMQYMKQYTSFRKIQGEEIKGKLTELERLNEQLGADKKKKEVLLTESEQQKKQLEKDKKEQEKLVKAIQKDKKKYTAEIRKKQQEAKDVQKQIDKAIKEAIAAANRKAAAAATTPAEKKEVAAAAAAAPNKIVLTKELKLVADNFTANKGRLPWPVEKGYVSSSYGAHAHAVHKQLEEFNNGVTITTEKGAAVRAIFGGEVTQIQIQPGTGYKLVYIQHGNYFTLYTNLSSVNVSRGDKVSTKQNIGTVATTPSGKTELNFFVLQNTTFLNPSSWIAK